MGGALAAGRTSPPTSKALCGGAIFFGTGTPARGNAGRILPKPKEPAMPFCAMEVSLRGKEERMMMMKEAKGARARELVSSAAR